MNRRDMLSKLQEPEKVWDMVVVGGGATGLGVAVDAATRGYSVVLLEMVDFAKEYLKPKYETGTRRCALSSKRGCRFGVRGVKGERANESECSTSREGSSFCNIKLYVLG